MSATAELQRHDVHAAQHKSDQAGRLVALVFYLVMMAFTYYILRELFNEVEGEWAALGLLALGAFIFIACLYIKPDVTKDSVQHKIDEFVHISLLSVVIGAAAYAVMKWLLDTPDSPDLDFVQVLGYFIWLYILLTVVQFLRVYFGRNEKGTGRQEV